MEQDENKRAGERMANERAVKEQKTVKPEENNRAGEQENKKIAREQQDDKRVAKYKQKSKKIRER